MYHRHPYCFALLNVIPTSWDEEASRLIRMAFYVQPDRFAEEELPSYRWLTCCAVEVHDRLAGYEDVNDSERLSLIRPSGRDMQCPP